jgi:hypothetical protein
LVHGQLDAVNSAQIGTKASPHYQLIVAAGATEVVQLRLSRTTPGQMGQPFAGFDAIVQTRLKEADDFYDFVTPATIKTESPEQVNLMRQALGVCCR